MKKRPYVKYFLCNILVFIIFVSNLYAQSKHAQIWYIYGYKFDFTSHQTQISKIKNQDFNTVWYIDENGNHALTVTEGNLYDENMQKIAGNNDWMSGFFVPMPMNENFVYYFGKDKIYLIDVPNKTVRDIVLNNCPNPVFDFARHIVVQHKDCDKMWIINKEDDVTREYLINFDGIKKIREISLYQNEQTAYRTNLSLSRNCKQYVRYNSGTKEIYYGDFDNKTGIFTQKAYFKFGEDIKVIYGAIIAPDNLRIYCILRSTNRRFKIVEIPIEDNIPQFEKQKLIIDKKAGMNDLCKMLYAVDGKIYIIENPNRICSTLTLDADGETKYEVIYNFDSILTYHQNDFVSSWFENIPCSKSSSNPCNGYNKKLKIIME